MRLQCIWPRCMVYVTFLEEKRDKLIIYTIHRSHFELQTHEDLMRQLVITCFVFWKRLTIKVYMILV